MLLNEVIAAIYARAKNNTATILPAIPSVPKPVGKAINNVPTVELETTDFRPKLITIGKVIIPAKRPTAVSREATETASFGN